MFFYHVTSEEKLPAILKEGLRAEWKINDFPVGEVVWLSSSPQVYTAAGLALMLEEIRTNENTTRNFLIKLVLNSSDRRLKAFVPFIRPLLRDKLTFGLPPGQFLPFMKHWFVYQGDIPAERIKEWSVIDPDKATDRYQRQIAAKLRSVRATLAEYKV